MTYSATQYPLTKRWEPLIHRLANEYKKSFEDVLQEALILEWSLPNRLGHRYENAGYRENYYKKALHHLWELKKMQRDGYARKRLEIVLPDDEDGTGMQKVFDSIVQTRPFEQLFYEDLLLTVIDVLLQVDTAAAEMFKLRMEGALTWQKIRMRSEFKTLPHNKFQNKVALIKRTVKDQIAFRGSLAGLGCLS